MDLNMPGKTSRKRRRVGQVQTVGLLMKRFNPVTHVRKRVKPRKIHPLIVIRDLREGCLDSLEAYLFQEKGIPDPAVAIELRKLLVGSPSRSHHRLICIDHPRGPKSKGGRPKGNGIPTERNFQIAHAVRETAKKGEIEGAVLEVADRQKIKPTTVYKHLRKVTEYENSLRAQEIESRHKKKDFTRASEELRASIERRKLALSKLKDRPR